MCHSIELMVTARPVRLGFLALLAAGAGLLALGCRRSGNPAVKFAEWAPGLAYTNSRVPQEPWSIHIVRVEWRRPDLSVETVHAGGRALGLSPLTEQLTAIPATTGRPAAAVNGDFYQRDGPHAGDPRGLQIAHGEVLSAPDGGVAFWLDAAKQPRAGPVRARFQIEWPDGTKSPFGLNQERGPEDLVLFTEAAGPRTQTPSGRELVLAPDEAGPTVLSPGARVKARIREMRPEGNTLIAPGTWVLSIGPGVTKHGAAPAAGDELIVSAGTDPDLTGCRTAIGGGPILLTHGSIHGNRPRNPDEDSYQFSSMEERHPRSAVGWNDTYLFLVLVDGRQPGLSEGMTLTELARTLRGLGCTEAINLDGGGSATLWADGKIRNSPCDGYERPVANGLAIVRRPSPGP